MNNKYLGLTVNERLYVSGLMSKFDDATKKKNVNEVLLILNKIDITDQKTIDDILKAIGLNAI